MNNLNYGTISISSKFVMPVYGFPFDKETDKKLWHNKFKVIFKNSKTKKSVSFPFYGSFVDHEKGIKEITDIYEVLDIFMREFFDSKMSFQEFCYEFGYNEDSIMSLNIYKALKRHNKKLLSIFDNDEKEIDEFSHFIQEKMEEKYNA